MIPVASSTRTVIAAKISQFHEPRNAGDFSIGIALSAEWFILLMLFTFGLLKLRGDFLTAENSAPRAEEPL